MKLLIYKNKIFIIFCLLLVLTILLNSCQSCVEDDLGGNGGGGGGANGDGTPVFEKSAYVKGNLDLEEINVAVGYIPDPRPLPSETIYEDISVVSIILRSDLLTRSDFFKASQITADIYASISTLDSSGDFLLEVPVDEDFFMFVVAKGSETEEATYLKSSSEESSSSIALGIIKYQVLEDGSSSMYFLKNEDETATATEDVEWMSEFRSREEGEIVDIEELTYYKEGSFFGTSKKLTPTDTEAQGILIDGETPGEITMESGRQTAFQITFYDPETEVENITYSMSYSKIYNDENKPDFCTLIDADSEDATAELMCNPDSEDEGAYPVALIIDADFGTTRESDSVYLSLRVDPETSTEDGGGEASGEKEWTHPSGLTDTISIDTKQSGIPQVAMDDNGNAIIVWEQLDKDAKNRVFKSEYRKKADNSWGWEFPEDIDDYISPYDATSVSAPRVAMDNNGNAIIVWLQSDGNYQQVFKSEYRSGKWTHPSSTSDNISPNGTNAYSFGPRVAMDNNGNAIIVWSQEVGGKNYIFKSEYRNGSWDHPDNDGDRISSASINSTEPQVAMSDNKDAVIVWKQENAYSDIAMVDYRYEKTNQYNIGNWSTIDYVSSGSNSQNPQVAMDDDGNAIIVWQQLSGAVNRIFMSEYRSKTWDYGACKSCVIISPSGLSAGDPQVAMDNNGDAIIAWGQAVESQAGNFWKIFKSEYRKGIWTHPGAGSTIYSNYEDASNPKVAMDNNGNAIIVWDQEIDVNNGYQIFKSEYKDGVLKGSIGSISPADNYPTGPKDTGGLSVAMDDDENAIITWFQGNGATSQIYKSEYR